jgi:hypothetical protein
MTEQQVYSVVERRRGYELRRYPAHVEADVEMVGSFERAGNAGFGPLVSYISGRNRSGSKVAMTAPVIQAPTEDPTRHRIAFVMPKGATLDTLPAPVTPGVELHEVPEAWAAVATFSGRWTESSYQRNVAALVSALARDGIQQIGPPRYARFDPPWKPWMLRRNEVVVPVAAPESVDPS